MDRCEMSLCRHREHADLHLLIVDGGQIQPIRLWMGDPHALFAIVAILPFIVTVARQHTAMMCVRTKQRALLQRFQTGIDDPALLHPKPPATAERLQTTVFGIKHKDRIRGKDLPAGTRRNGRTKR